jgi:transcriptional regulator with XRE-family HTH domain
MFHNERKHISVCLPPPCYPHSMAGRPPTKPAPAFGTQLSALRKERGLTQHQLADKLGISLDMLIYYERRAQNPTADFVAKAAAALGASADVLLGQPQPRATKRTKPGPASLIEERLQAVRNLPRDKQKVVLQLLDSFLQSHSKAS